MANEDEERGTSTRSWSVHLVGGAGIALCVAAGTIEVIRAVGGNGLSWVYVVEWPVLGTFGAYLWWKLAREQRGAAPTRDRQREHADLDAAARATGSGSSEVAVDGD